ncbi:hypothetical protein QQS21_012456 [Conoideocrella luteorostrata]|uniref:Rhodopsin domain-containing protein n=1 Tax=Conoideocrella luteorostrata TaxID=1105319 RepID=A0AAJ0CB58_9HYPO|nr:hypothetical protein QQS21_012456 [Conoideocrella luteorostrata]
MDGSAPPPNMPLQTDVLSTGISRLAVNAVVATALAIARFVIRGKDGLGVDDYFLMVSLVFYSYNGLLLHDGSGWEMADLITRPDKVEWILKFIYFPELSYTIVATLIKISILYSYKRIFGRNKWTKIHIYVLLGLSWAWGVAMFFTIIFQCTPVEKAWKPQLEGHCIPVVPFLWGNSISNFIIDRMILFVPVVPVLKLQLPNGQKILVVLSFLIGSVACIASTVRSAATAKFNETNIGIADYNASIWVFIEIPIATISCCLPFLTRIFSIKAMEVINKISTRVRPSKASKASKTSRGTEKESFSNKSRQSKLSASAQRHYQQPQDRHNIYMTTTTSVSHESAVTQYPGMASNGYAATANTAPSPVALRDFSRPARGIHDYGQQEDAYRTV